MVFAPVHHRSQRVSVGWFGRIAVRSRSIALSEGKIRMDIDKVVADVEAVSELYAQKNSIDRTPEWFVLKLNEEVGELTQAFLAKAGQARDKGKSTEELDAAFASEIADTLAQVLVLAHHFEVNVMDELEKKWFLWHPDRHRPGR